MSSIETDIIQNPENVSLDPFKPLFVKTIDEIITEEVESERLNSMSKSANIPPKITPFHHKTLSELSINMSSSLLSLIDDLFDKPSNSSWPSYLVLIFNKNNRMTYIGIIFIIISILFNLFT